MTRYETLQAELNGLRLRQRCAVIAPALGTAIIAAPAAGSNALWLGLAIVLGLPFVLHRLWRILFPAYRTRSDLCSEISREIRALRERVAGVFDKYRERRKGEAFKKAYDLNGRPVRELEEALSVGMFREQREVFVTAFMRGGVAVRVTASIGSPFRCSAADDPGRWGGHVERLRCDEIRQYHNHPDYHGKTSPSPLDIRTAGALRSLLSPCGVEFRSLIICWNGMREWKIFEHDETGGTRLHFEFDAAVDVTIAGSAVPATGT